MTLAVELPGIEDVVPNAIEAAGQRADGSEKGVAHPDGKDGVLLAKSLTGGDFSNLFATFFYHLAVSSRTVAAADESARYELESTANQ